MAADRTRRLEMKSTNARDSFFRTLRDALGRSREGSTPPDPIGRDLAAAETRADAARRAMEADADALLAELAESAAQVGWRVFPAQDPEQAGGYVREVARAAGAKTAVLSAHAVLERIAVERALAAAGVRTAAMATAADDRVAEAEGERGRLRRAAAAADLGVTGVDYAIAETGTCILLHRPGVGRLASLLPPVHVAVVERGQVVADLDDLFALLSARATRDGLESAVTLISGPSRSGDIEQTLVTGVHGPGEVHLVLLG